MKPAAPAIMAAGVFAGTSLPDNSRPMLLLDVGGIAAIAGLPVGIDREEAPAPVEPATIEALVPTLVFVDLDGAERAIRLALVERIEDVAVTAIRQAAGRLHLAQDGRVSPLLTCGAPLPDRRVRILRLSDGSARAEYAIDRVVDILPLAAEPLPAAAPGLVAGVLPFQDRAIELLDAFWLFAEAATPNSSAQAESRPLCLLAGGADSWTRQVLAPLVAAAGYRVAYADDPSADAATADVIIASGGVEPPGAASAPVVRLRPEPAQCDDGTIYRYDRTALLDALRTSVGRRA